MTTFTIIIAMNDDCIPGSAGEVLVLSVRDVLPRPVVPILLGKTKVYQKELVAVPPNPHQEIVWLDVAVDEILVVHILHPPDHLVRQHEDGLHGKSPGAEVEEVLKAGSQEIHHQDIVVAFHTKPPDVRDAHPALHRKIILTNLTKLNIAGSN